MSEIKAKFDGDTISLSEYPFRPGYWKRPVSIRAREIREADVALCTVRVADEIIYLPGWPRAELTEYCEKNGIALVRRYDAWSDILAPYVDTSYTGAEVSARESRLRAAGFTPARVRKLRLFVSFPIIIYQGIAGEWTGLHQYDLLSALRWLKLLGLYGLAYRASMKVALDGPSANA